MADSLFNFTGRYEHLIDDKGRLMLPSLLRDGLARSQVPERIYLGFYPGNKFLSLYPQERWETLASGWRDEKRFSSTQVMQDVQRLFFSNIEQLYVDRSGRVLIPAIYRERAGIGPECAVLGVSDKIELWNPIELEARQARALESWERCVAEELSRSPSSEDNRLPSF
jgi:MraZ protein